MNQRVISCDVAAVVVTLKDSPRLHQAIASVRSSVTPLNIAVICVINDPSASGNWTRDGVHYVGAGMNLGWAGGMHAGLIGVDSQYVWAIQDDMIVDPDALETLVKALDRNPELASVRPLNVDARGVVAASQQGNQAKGTGRFVTLLPRRATRAQDLTPIENEGYLASSGQLIRREVWDALGGFDPWYYPWGHIDVDFAQTLRKSGWKFQTVLDAHMTHMGQTSTTSNFRTICIIRHNFLYDSKWGLEVNGDFKGTPPISPWIVQSAKNSAAQPRDVDLDSLHNMTAIAAADLAIWISRAMEDELSYLSLRQMVVDPKVRRSVTRRTFQAIRRRMNAPRI